MAATVCTWNVAQSVQQRGLSPPHRAFLVQSLRCPPSRPTHARAVLTSGADAMAIDAHDIALGHLRQDLGGGHEHRATGHDVERLRSRIAVVKVELIRFESAATIRAWDSSQVAEEFNHAGLSNPDSLVLDVAVTAVVLDVVLSLTGTNAHVQI